MASFKNEKFSIQVGDIVIGRKGKHLVKGIVLESTKKRGKPAIFSRWGFVGCWVELESGQKTVINEIRLI
jgi:hypothetical protein